MYIYPSFFGDCTVEKYAFQQTRYPVKISTSEIVQLAISFYCFVFYICVCVK